MQRRELPGSLRTALRTAQRLEQEADSPTQRQGAIAATSRLLLAAHETGWRQRELADFLQWPRQTVQVRIAAARRTSADPVSGLTVEPPPSSVVSRPRDVLRRPLEQRDWLTLHEAAIHVDRSVATIQNWLTRGALPNTDRRSAGWYLYARSNLDRVLAAPRRGRRQRYPDFERLLQEAHQ